MFLFWNYLGSCPFVMPNETYKKNKKLWNSSSWCSSSIPIATFKESYSGILNGTRAPWTRVLCFFFFFFFFKFDLPIPIAVFRESYSGVLNRTWVSFFILFYFLNLITPYSIFYKSSFTLKLKFEKIEFQKRDMDLNSFKIGTYY